MPELTDWPPRVATSRTAPLCFVSFPEATLGGKGSIPAKHRLAHAAIISLCLAIMIWLISFGDIQDVFLPPLLQDFLYLAACGGLAFVAASTSSLRISLIAVYFVLGVLFVLILQCLWLAGSIVGIASKTIPTLIIFGLLASVPVITPGSLLRIIRHGAMYSVLISVAVVALTGLGTRQDTGAASISWIGWFDHKNYLGLAAAISLSLISAEILRKRSINLTCSFLVVISALTLYEAQSRGAILWFVAFSVCIVASMCGFSVRALVCTLLVGATGLVLFVLLGPMGELHWLSGVTTGRTVIWEQARPLFEDAVWFGRGMGFSYRGGALFFDAYGNTYQGVHNGYIAILIDFGLVGFCTYMVMIILTVFALGSRRSWDRDILLSVLGAFIVYNFVEAALDKTTNLSFILFPLVLAACSGWPRNATPSATLRGVVHSRDASEP